MNNTHDDDFFDGEFDWEDAAIIGSFVDYMYEEEEEDERRRKKIEKDLYPDTVDDLNEEPNDPEKLIP